MVTGDVVHLLIARYIARGLEHGCTDLGGFVRMAGHCSQSGGQQQQSVLLYSRFQ